MSAPDMRNVNAIQLLNLIRESGPISRANLAKLSNLSKPTVSEQVGRLISHGVVVETGPGEAGTAGGKRPTLIAFHADAGRVAGVGVGPDVTQIGIAGLQGELKSQIEIRTSPDQGPRRLLDRIERALSGLLSREPVEERTLRSIGIGVPGRVDCTAGVVLESGNVFGWNHVDVRSPLAKHFGCSVVVDNDVNVAMVGELHSGAARNVNTAVLIRVDTGIGSAVAMNRRIHHGTHWAAGEIGHLAADRTNPKNVSPRGQLETIVGADQIGRRVRAAARQSAVLRRLLDEHPETRALFVAAKQRDSAALKIAADISHHLCVAVAHQALAYDPDVVLLAGEVFDHVLPEIRKFLSRTVPWSPRITQAGFGAEGILIGAIDAALIEVYEQMARQLSADTGPAVAAAGA